MRRLLPVLTLLACSSTRPILPERPLTLPAPETRAVVVVRVPAPWWAPRFAITSKFVDAIPEYAVAPGLAYKAFTVGEDGRFGGVYLWDSRSVAEGWFDEKWHARVRNVRGVDGEVRVLDARFTVPGPAVPQGKALPMHGLRTDAFVVWAWSVTAVDPEETESRLRALAEVHALPPGLLRVSFVSEPEGRLGAVSLFTSRAEARAFWSAERLASAGAAIGAKLEVTGFDAPVLLDAAAAKQDLR